MDTFVSEERMLKDPRRLYPPGRLFHITYKEPCHGFVTQPILAHELLIFKNIRGWQPRFKYKFEAISTMNAN